MASKIIFLLLALVAIAAAPLAQGQLVQANTAIVVTPPLVCAANGTGIGLPIIGATVSIVCNGSSVPVASGTTGLNGVAVIVILNLGNLNLTNCVARVSLPISFCPPLNIPGALVSQLPVLTGSLINTVFGLTLQITNLVFGLLRI